MRTIKKLLVLYIFCITCFSAIPQTYSIKATVKGISNKTVYLSNYFGGQATVLDSANVDNSESFYFKLNDNYKTGLYKITLGRNLNARYYDQVEKYVAIIFNKENIDFTTYFDSPVDSMKILLSFENKIYYDFLQKENRNNIQLEILSQLPVYFPKQDEFYPDIEKRYNDIQTQQQNYISALLKNNPNTYASHIIKSTRFPVLEFSLPEEAKQQFIKKHFLDNVDFTDTLLLRSDIFTSKAFAYIQLFRSKSGMEKEQQEQEFIKAIDTLMLKSRVNDRINRQLRDYIIKGFETLDMDKILEYIAERYIPQDICENDQQSSSLKKRFEGYKKLIIGNKVPEIIFTDNNNKTLKLSEIKSPYTLVLFWASWCPHCKEMLPELKKIYEEQKEKKLEVLAISIDTNKTEFKSTIEKGLYKWINFCDFKGWNGNAAIDYCLYATPTMILLDKDKKIISKPMTLMELKDQLP